jgi:hypothetical protein
MEANMRHSSAHATAIIGCWLLCGTALAKRHCPTGGAYMRCGLLEDAPLNGWRLTHGVAFGRGKS